MRSIKLILDTGFEHEDLIIENNKGEVANQYFWQGRPAKLIGFVRDKLKKVQNNIDLDHQTFWDNPYMSVGKYAVFADQHDEWYTSPNIIKECVILEE